MNWLYVTELFIGTRSMYRPSGHASLSTQAGVAKLATCLAFVQLDGGGDYTWSNKSNNRYCHNRQTAQQKNYDNSNSWKCHRNFWAAVDWEAKWNMYVVVSKSRRLTFHTLELAVKRLLCILNLHPSLTTKAAHHYWRMTKNCGSTPTKYP